MKTTPAILLASIRHAGELLYLLVRKELRVRYKSSFLGYLWTVANPFAFALTYWLAFKWIMRVEVQNYSLFLLSALFPWVCFSNGIIQATSSYRNNVSLIKKVNLNRAILPLSSIAQEVTNLLFAIPVLVLFFYFSASIFHVSWLWQVPTMIAVQLILAFPIALMLALANVFVRDVEYLIGIGFSLLFFLTPIIYPLDMVPAQYRPLFSASPIFALVEAWRSVFFKGALDLRHMLYCIGVGSVLGLLAYATYRKLSHRIGELL